jgi:hypothetical protein
VTGFGGFATMPLTVPVAMLATWINRWRSPHVACHAACHAGVPRGVATRARRVSLTMPLGQHAPPTLTASASNGRAGRSRPSRARILVAMRSIFAARGSPSRSRTHTATTSTCRRCATSCSTASSAAVPSAANHPRSRRSRCTAAPHAVEGR